MGVEGERMVRGLNCVSSWEYLAEEEGEEQPSDGRRNVMCRASARSVLLQKAHLGLRGRCSRRRSLPEGQKQLLNPENLVCLEG